MRTVEHTTHHERVHQFTFFEATRETVDEWMTLLEVLLQRTDSTQPLSLLLDMRQSGVLPLATIHTRLHSLFAAQTTRPPGKVAILIAHETLHALVNSLLQIFSRTNEAQSFHDYDSAWVWISIAY
jgi:hypothetical protein